ncbi:Gfo/Idh/MocA family protein [Cellulomonas taurus]|uniref:Gfo/Idh/MocA family protein n=1 Tax=Cellulomonas taurus TaxID=2729175 RepID=UPI00145DA785|nr:Gfo/Idh/MocA family oxidoreductase [Cellulomonas taurus]
MLRHAIIGCGRVAPNHIDAFAAVDGWEVALVCDEKPRAAAFAAEYAVPAWTDRAEDVLADDDITSVSVAVGHHAHADLVEAALRAGKHVIVEKPFGLDPERSRDLARYAATQDLTLTVVSQHRYDPVVAAVRSWLDEGLLGTVVYATATLQAHRSPDYYSESTWRGRRAGEGGSALINQGYHCLDVLRWLCGDLEVERAVSRTVALADVIETEDTLCGLLTTSAGAPVLLGITVASAAQWRTRIEIVGTEGSVSFDLDHPGRLHDWHGSPALCERASAEQARGVQEDPPGLAYYGVSHRRQIADFCAAVSEHRAMMFAPLDALGTLATITELYRQGERP